jgi:GNAT superfamily N-acetyltransferase
MIRLYQEKYCDLIFQIWLDASEFAMPGLASRAGFTKESMFDYFKNTIVVENQIWIYEKENQPVAFLALENEFIDRLYVLPNLHRQNIGTTLINHAKTISPNHLWLFTHQANKACAFYEKHGFIAEKFDISPPPESEPDVEYHWYKK